MIFFHAEHNKLIQTLDKLRVKHCSYGGHVRCDCKYGYLEREDHCEICGCPELNCAKLIVEALTPSEWNRILKRLTKDKKAYVDSKYFYQTKKPKRTKKNVKSNKQTNKS